jgi:carotenoid cleavage dioxygenase
MLAFSYVGPLTYFRIDHAGRVVEQVPIDVPAPVMMHDFAVTHEHVIFLDAPAVMDIAGWLAGGPMSTWEPERGTRLGVMPRAGGDVRWFEIETSWVAHFLNAYTDGTRVIVDGCRVPAMNFMLDPSEQMEGAAGSLTRFTVDLAAGTAGFEALDDRIADFPRVNDDHACGPHRYGYVSWFASGGTGVDFDAVVKYDLDAGTASTHVWGPGTAVGEFSFAPDPAGSAEDDGWLLSIATDLATRASELVVLDARDVAAGPIARVPIPRRVPAGFHGNWFAA